MVSRSDLPYFVDVNWWEGDADNDNSRPTLLLVPHDWLERVDRLVGDPSSHCERMPLVEL